MAALFVAFVGVVVFGLLCCFKVSGNCAEQERREECKQREERAKTPFTVDTAKMETAMREAVTKAGLKGGD